MTVDFFTGRQNLGERRLNRIRKRFPKLKGLRFHNVRTVSETDVIKRLLNSFLFFTNGPKPEREIPPPRAKRNLSTGIAQSFSLPPEEEVD